MTIKSISRFTAENIDGVLLSLDLDRARAKMRHLANNACAIDGCFDDRTRIDWGYDFDEVILFRDGFAIFVMNDQLAMIRTDAFMESYLTSDCRCELDEFTEGSRFFDRELLEDIWIDMVAPLKWFLALPEEELIEV